MEGQMAKQSKRQKEIVGRVMHEFKHGELETGTGKQVQKPKQAIAIALHEAGASNQESPEQNARSRRKTEAKERKGETAMQQKEGKGALRSKRSTGASSRSTGKAGERSRSELYEIAKQRDIPGRSKMSKDELARAVL
jgi:Family of unknown function (DUF6496)